MNTLLLFFALPVATIILAVVLQKILRCPLLTAATFFAIYLIVAFAVFDSSFLVFVIAYTILAFVAAIIAEYFFRRCNGENNYSKCNICNCIGRNNNSSTLSNQDVRRIAEQLANILNNNSCNCNNNNHNTSNDVVSVNATNNTTGGRTNWCCYRR